jgi:hypothetical protein
MRGDDPRAQRAVMPAERDGTAEKGPTRPSTRSPGSSANARLDIKPVPRIIPIRTYAEQYRDRCRHVRLRLNFSMYLYLHLYLYLYLLSYAALFQKPFAKPSASSFASRPASVLGLYLNLNLNLVLSQPPWQSPVYHPHGRIVVPTVSDHYL